MKLLLLSSSVYGHVTKVCEVMRPVLEQAGIAVVQDGFSDEPPAPSDFDAVMIGASIRNGKHNPAVITYIDRHQAALAERPSAFFSINLVARKPHKNTPETNPYVRKFLEASPWQPDQVGVFGGQLNYRRYKTMDRWVIRFIMWMNKGPTDLDTNADFTDWDAVRDFAERFAKFALNRQQ